MRSGNTDAKREVQIIASWSLLSQSDWIRYTQHRVDWQDCWIESVRKDGFIQLVLLADRKWRAWLIFTKAMNDNATQYLRNQTSIRHIEPICYNLSINYTWISVLFSFDIQNGESKRFPNDLMRSGPSDTRRHSDSWLLHSSKQVAFYLRIILHFM